VVHRRFSVLLTSGGGGIVVDSLACLSGLRGFVGIYLSVVLISSATNGMPELSWSVLLLSCHGALNAIRSILDCTRCMIFVFDGLVQPQSYIP
jgi:hypothetical protein